MLKISIGLPIYNEEKFIENKLKNILQQTEQNFEVIISDNASTDKTQQICEKFAKEDNRIIYFRQPKNFGVILNFKYVLDKANAEYFVWTSGDDLWGNEFLEQTSKQLDENKNLVGCMSKLYLYDKINNVNYNEIKVIQISDKHYRKSFNVETLSGTYENKVYRLLHNPSYALYVHSLFRIQILRECSKHSFSLSWDRALIFNILKYGDLLTLNKFLYARYTKGISNVGIIDQYRIDSITLSELFFPYGDLLKWYLKNLNNKLIIKNLDIFIKLSFSGFVAIGLSIFRKSNYKGSKKVRW